MGLDVLDRVEVCGQDIWRWYKSYNKQYQKKIECCKLRLDQLRMRRDPLGLREYSETEKEYLTLLN